MSLILSKIKRYIYKQKNIFYVMWLPRTATIFSWKMIEHNNIKFYKIKDFEDYYISKCGKVLSTKKCLGGKLLNKRLNIQGYPVININKTSKLLHRLLAETFVLNPNNFSIVEHIDDNPLNHSLDNLKWSTQKANIQKAYNVGRKKGYWVGKKHCNRKKVAQYDLDGNLIKIWDSISDVVKDLGFKLSNIIKVCKGQRNQTGGFKWEYK